MTFLFLKSVQRWLRNQESKEIFLIDNCHNVMMKNESLKIHILSYAITTVWLLFNVKLKIKTKKIQDGGC